MRPSDRTAEVLSGRRQVVEALTDRDAGRPQGRADVSEDDTRVRAYQLWEAAGRPEGDGVEFWLRAERELRG